MPEPEAPRAVPDVTWKMSGKVTPATPSSLQAILDTATPGEQIVCDPSAPWVGNWVLRRFPPTGVRCMLTSSRSDVPVRFMTPTPQPVFTASGGGGGYHFLNCEITLGPTVNYAGGQSLVQLGTGEPLDQCPRSFVFEKCHVFGNPGQDVRRGILANCADFAFIDGRVSEIHQRGSDSQAICAWNSPGPFLLRDSVLEAAGENVMFGGSDATSEAMGPQDITLERVILRKPIEWKGKGWTVKNCFELKNAKRVRLSGVLMENCWSGEGQSGYAIVLTPRNQNGTNPWTAVQDVLLEHIEVRNATALLNLLGTDNLQPSQRTARIRITNLLMTGGGASPMIQMAGPTDVGFTQTTIKGSSKQVMLLTSPPSEAVSISDAVWDAGNYGIFGDGVGAGQPAIDRYLPGAIFSQVVLVSGVGIWRYPPGLTVVPTRPASGGCDLVALAAAQVKPSGAPPVSLTVEDRLTRLELKVFGE